MPAKTSDTAPRRRVIGWAMVALATFLGGADSIYLIYTHVQHKLGREVAGFCDISVSFNCGAAVDSAYSTLFGVPIAVFALAFYVAMLLLVLRGGPRRSGREPGWAIVVWGFVGATIYSMYLLGILVFGIGIVCPGCLVLDAVNLIGLVGALLAPGMGLGKLFRSSAGDLQRALFGSAGFGFILAFTLVLLGAALITLEQLEVPERHVAPDEAYNIVENQGDRQDLSAADSAPVRGNPSAPVTIVSFSDFQCPYCRRFAQALDRIVEAHPDEVQVRFMNYPLNGACNPYVSSAFHEQACTGARAGVCADEQGRFWEMHDLLFANNTHLDRDSVDDMARSVGLDVDQFMACMDADYSLERVRSEATLGHEAAEAAGATRFGTPFSFVNGLLVKGARSYSELEALARRELEQVAQSHSSEPAGDNP